MRFRVNDERIEVNVPDADTLLIRVRERLMSRRGFALATLNLDHLVKLRSDADFARAYAMQDFVVADGQPIVWLSRVARRPVSLAPGSDMVIPLARAAQGAGVAVALVGSTDGALRRAARTLEAEVPGLRIALCLAPSRGFDPDSVEAKAVLDRVVQSGAGLCFLALGAPKQERFAARAMASGIAVGFASIGAGLDFLAGEQRRAPRWMRAVALEWLWRAGGAPSRMVPRYAACFAVLPRLCVQAVSLRREQA